MFFDNKDKIVTNYPPVYLYTAPSPKVRIESTNFQNITDYCVICANAATAYLQYCCFANNNVTWKYFFEYSRGKITIDSCFIDVETPKTEGSVTINNRIKDISNNDKCINFIKKKEVDISDLDENPKYNIFLFYLIIL
ncbi:hypothetical protein TVAG_045070 [Trichomonas vaginalis G3]|uniref:Uncharacterized protein n=1 Tax=Trichomonas vaginalis (strain ATCC PRA-98 / G3) TaxID=412133 RepID=A2E8F5_TRIV3|nr:hypothetical protein TVAGG3_0550520 [Trichomonas vaginalis G3]EAY11083.1 hypothetical protein TVAG_045070 [Trichomonas vaginalis G3]KAI5520469.1 hypothetical protein TVAGG3_0550520 [Trichomonas vaginalis G3]|eukprot:XP_001323306.1 hypothetical protein [Trichomonas vaginalis G3]